jgi:hypothetical protein
MEFRLARRSSATAGESEHTSWSVVSSHVVDVLTRPAILLASSQNTVHGLEMMVFWSSANNHLPLRFTIK